ncbi:hypothetical protein PBY51_008985 [Eleginops maclovinus]|uniref:Uncharacterized protein n=1 Tax=Eleginops maclovinus TaxID=56733 RepID=A0AAN7WTJ3_ELEMC|nr:hypothetical protein PBY51_008985 [Eleginops maclovinus]
MGAIQYKHVGRTCFLTHRVLSKLVLEVQGERTESQLETEGSVSSEILPSRFHVAFVTSTPAAPHPSLPRNCRGLMPG